MSRAMVSEHIPDLDLITFYAEKHRSPFSEVSPWTKIALLFLIITLITVTRNMALLVATYAIVLGCFACAGLPVKKLFYWYTIPMIFVVSLVGIMIWSEPGVPLFTLPLPGFPLTLTDQGLILIVTLVVKALISITYSIFILMTTRYEYLSGVISRVFPSPLDQIFLMAYRFLFLTLAMTGQIIKAFRSRGGGVIASIRTQWRMFAGIFGLVFIRSFERAERVNKAMQARGFNGIYSTNATIPAPGFGGYAMLLFLSIFVVAIAIQSNNLW
ncbi:MAG: cobalt ECF transporter T component CbiQ [Methanoregula sp.]